MKVRLKESSVLLDVGDAKALRAWVEDTAKEFGGIDMAVANVSALAIPDEEERSVDVDEPTHLANDMTGGHRRTCASRSILTMTKQLFSI